MSTGSRAATRAGEALAKGRGAGLMLLAAMLGGLVTVDIVNGLTGATEGLLSIGELVRGGYLVLAMAIAVLTIGSIWPVGIMGLATVLLGCAVVAGAWGSFYRLGYELGTIAKVLYGPCAAFLVYRVFREYPELELGDLLRQLAIAGLVVAAALFGSVVMGVSGRIYGQYSFGQKGLFSSQNDISHALVLTLPAATWWYFAGRALGTWIPLAAIAGAGLLVGTRTGIFGAVVVPLVSTLLLIWSRRWQAWRPMGWRVVLLLAGGVTVGAIMYRVVVNDRFLMRKIIEFVETGRAKGRLQEVGWQRLQERPTWMGVTGEGFAAFQRSVQTEGQFAARGAYGKYVEVDWMDLAGAFGWVGAGTVYALYLGLWLLACRRVLRRPSAEGAIALLTFSGFLLHSVIAGHALFKPLPGTLAAGLIGGLLGSADPRPTPMAVPGGAPAGPLDPSAPSGDVREAMIPRG